MKLLSNFTFLVIFIEMMKVQRSNGAQKTLHHLNDVRNLSHHSDVIDHIQLDDGKVLKRDKRFLLFSGAGIAKVNDKLSIVKQSKV